ncbi:hypothetical protein WK13_34380 [Burkholderia ubonensis]|uniref:hypothetical protein n=1 Tax=Burkholderia ubonensis TaxID=101571 RepID=UPI0007578295|nr:hypothetical protein [Burkholderia ubonensis]KVR21627.1 hypothetical protein WK13_34380 [Burkholderia ubonensis]
MAVTWIKQGQASVAAAQQDDAEYELRKQQQGKMFRFYLDDKEEAQITFVDGALNDQGFLVPPRFYEHGLKVNGKFQTFICPEKSDPDSGQKCPICEQGDRPYLASAFTVIDHRIRKAKNSDKTYQHVRRLFIAKPGTFEILNKLALKTGGLAGITFDVSRVGDKAPAVGSVFMPIGQTPIEQLQASFMEDVLDDKGNPTGQKKTYFLPADYGTEVPFLNEQELRQIGFGKTMGGFGGGGFQPGGFSGGFQPGGFAGNTGFNPANPSAAVPGAAAQSPASANTGGFKPGSLPMNGGASGLPFNPAGGAVQQPAQQAAEQPQQASGGPVDYSTQL